MKTILKDRNSPFEISAKNDHSIMSVMENIRLTVPIYTSPYNKPEYMQVNLMTLLNAVKWGRLKIVQTDPKK